MHPREAAPPAEEADARHEDVIRGPLNDPGEPPLTPALDSVVFVLLHGIHIGPSPTGAMLRAGERT
jgi:hypothetical protein